MFFKKIFWTFFYYVLNIFLNHGFYFGLSNFKFQYDKTNLRAPQLRPTTYRETWATWPIYERCKRE